MASILDLLNTDEGSDLYTKQSDEGMRSTPKSSGDQ